MALTYYFNCLNIISRMADWACSRLPKRGRAYRPFHLSSESASIIVVSRPFYLLFKTAGGYRLIPDTLLRIRVRSISTGYSAVISIVYPGIQVSDLGHKGRGV